MNWICIAASLLALGNCGWRVALAAEPLTFDIQVLRDRGIDPALAEYFRDAARFTQGEHAVVLEVNGQPKGRVPMTFNDVGELCLGTQWLKAVGVRLPASVPLPPGQCVTAAQGFPAAIVQLNPGSQQVRLLVPTDTLAEPARAQRSFANGGVAGVFNYDLLMAGSQLDGQTSSYRSFSSEAGLNAGDWVLRSRQSFTALPDSSRFEHLYAYAMHTLEDHDASVQVGQLNLASSLFAGESFIGVQVFPEAAFARLDAARNGARGQVDGVAYSPSRIEVRQNGVTIYATMVPGGPFTLRALPLLSNQLDLEVAVHEQDGQVRRFRVPAANLQEAQSDAPVGFNLALGRVRRLSADNREAPTFAAFSQDWEMRRGLRATAGALAGSEYLSAGWGLQQQWAGPITLGLRQVVSEQRAAGLVGDQWQLTFSAPLAANLSASLVAVRQSRDFRTLSDTDWNQRRDQAESRKRDHWVFSLNGATGDWGAFGASWSRYSSMDEAPVSQLGLSWSLTLPQRVSLSLSVEQGIGGAEEYRPGRAAYLTVGIPLGGQGRLRGYVRSDERAGMRQGLAVSAAVSETLAYTVNAEHRDNTPAALAARINALPRYTSLDVGLGQRAGATEYDLGLRGGVLLHRDGVTLSPYALRDTLGVLKAGERSGVRLQTPQGPVWTDGAGRAVAANLPAYSLARLEVDPLGLPRNVEVLNGVQEVTAGRGSVQHLDFSLITVRRLLLKARSQDRQWLPRGLSVLDEQGQYLTSVMEAGAIFLPDIKPAQVLRVRLSDSSHCILHFPLSDLPDDATQMETVEAICRPAILS